MSTTMENSNNSNVNISLKSQWTLNNYLLTFVVGWIRLCSKGWARLRWYIKFVVLPVLAGTTVLHNLQTTLVWLRSDLYYPKNCHTGELTFPLLFTISSFAAALIFCLWKGIQQTSTRQRYGATKRDTVTWLAVSVSLPTLLGYQRASAFVNATKLASQPLFSSDEEYKISNVLSNTFFIDIDHVSIAIHIVIVLSPSPSSYHRRNGFILYKLYVLLAYTNPTPKATPYRKLFFYFLKKLTLYDL